MLLVMQQRRPMLLLFIYAQNTRMVEWKSDCAPRQLSQKSRHLVTEVTSAVFPQKWRPEEDVSPAKK